MIGRIWRGRTPASKSDAYLTFLEGTGLREYRETEGNLGVLVLRRETDGIAEFTRTFNIDTIDLYHGDPNNGGTLITVWSLLDEATNQVDFNQNGRVAVPEPCSLALLVGVSLSGLAILRRRRR